MKPSERSIGVRSDVSVYYRIREKPLNKRFKRNRLSDFGWIEAQTDGLKSGELVDARALTLVNRLLSVEERTMALRAQITRLDRELQNALESGSRSAAFSWDRPGGKQPWPLASNADMDEAALKKYDRRVDDLTVLEGRRGESFLELHGLLGANPDFRGAVAALNATQAVADIVSTSKQSPPDVSIVIPVYGQVGYTLNCVESLLTHRSRLSIEILIIDDCSQDASAELFPLLLAVRYFRQPVNGGFIKSCNQGGRLARGRHLIMLNNDTRVVSGWLDNLIASFSEFPAAGLVGSKMFYADGTLQEAGGIVWRDGSCWNYGRNDDPNKPEYCYARQVDYISGCSLAMPSDLWNKLNGFDLLYAPAYCEDVDLCLRIKAAGRQVWFQPQSRVIHYEGKTSGTDASKGTKSYQIINTSKLYLRWREALERHRPNGEAPYFEREREVRRRILVVDMSVPTPKQDAGSVQVLLALKVCQENGYKAHFVAGDNWLYQPDYTEELLKIGIECAYAPYDLSFETYMSRYGRLFDVVLVYRMNLLERIIADIRTHAPRATLLFHLSDLHYLRRQREADVEGGDARAEVASLKKRELALVNAADCTITHSYAEADILAKETPDAAVAVWPLMFEFFGTEVPFGGRKAICFLGGFGHSPNIDAVTYFTHEIFPLIRAVDSCIDFIIAGAAPTPEVKALAGEGVEVLGPVDDLRTLFDRARVFVCPLRFGAGAKGKVVSALSYGVPIVSSPIGVEGTGLTDGEDLLVARSPRDFAKKTLALYNDKALWDKLSSNGQRLVSRNFSTKMGGKIFEEIVLRGHARRLKIKDFPCQREHSNDLLTDALL